MPRGRQRGALPLAPGSVRFLAGRAARPESRPSSRAGSAVASVGQWRAGWGDVGPVGSSPPPVIYVPPVSFPLHDNCPDVTVDARASQEEYGSCGSGQSGEAGGAAPAGPPPVGPQHRLQRPAERGQVAVIDAAVVQLTGELAEQPRPVPTGRLERD